MDDTSDTLRSTRSGLHAVAELLLAGPQYREHDTVRLRITPGGFGQVAGPLRTDGTDLVVGERRIPLTGTVAQVAAAAGVEPGAPVGLYDEHAELGVDDPLVLDPAAVALLTGWFAIGDAGLRAFAPDVPPVLWPEHFDVAIAVDEVNYGVSLGDAGHPDPYAYVGPWTPLTGAFWNAPFGAVRAATALPDAAAVTEFLTGGRDAVLAATPGPMGT